MSQQLSLKEAERKAWRSVYQDGLWDIYLGLILLAMGTSSLLDTLNLGEVLYYTIFLGVLCLSMVVLWVGKRYITLPRLGRVRFGEKGKTRRKYGRLILFASVAFGLIVWFVATMVYQDGFSSSLPWDLIFPLVYVLNMLLVFGLGAYFLDYPRLYVIAVLFAIPVPLEILLKKVAGIDVPFWTFVIPAGIILGMGLVCLIRFMQTYPVAKVSEMENNHGARD